MTHPENADILSTVVQLLTEQGSAGFAEGIRLLVNEAMVRERSAALRAEPYQRSEARLGHSNGFKDKTLSTRVGKITFDVPQVRVARVFPNESSLLRLVSALLAEISEDWETGKIYLSIVSSFPPTT